MKRTHIPPILLVWALLFPNALLAFDHQHSLWNGLLQTHIHWINNGHASQVNYRGFKKDISKLDEYLTELSAVERENFNNWSKNRRKAFLINSYNAYTIQLILTRYPDVESIKDYGTLFSSPWSKQFITLFGEPTSLDEIEHKMLRKPRAYDDPFIHVAVVCASVGCPSLVNKAFTADNIEQLLIEAMNRFVSDRSRNRFNPDSGALEISKIFDWYEDDFEKGHRGINSVEELLSGYAQQLADNPQHQQRISKQKVKIDYLDYDWKLNDYVRRN